MTDAREQKYLDMIAQFPESPLGHFTLGKYYLETDRWREAVAPLEHCVREETDWAAAMVALGDAYAGVGEKQRAREILERARATAQAQNHPSLAEDIDERLEDLAD